MRKLSLPTVLSRLARPVVALVLAAGLAACGGGPEPGARRATGPALPAGPVPVALLVPLGAQNPTVAAQAGAIVNAARMAVEEGGNEIALLVLDTRGDVQGARTAAEQAAAQGAQLILGPLFGSNTAAVGAVAQAAGIRAISFSTDTTVAGDPVWVSGFTPEGEVARILGYAASRGLTRVGVYAPLDPAGDAVVRGVREAAPRTGTEVVTLQRYPRSFRDIQRTAPLFVAAAERAGAQAVLLPERGEGLPAVAAFIDTSGMPQPGTRYLGISQWNERTTLEEPALVGGWFASADPAATEDFQRRYQARNAARPPFVAVLGYDAARMASELVREARVTGDGTPFSLEDLTRLEPFEGGAGPFRFGPDGRVIRGLAVLEVGRNRFELLDPAALAPAAGS